MFKTRTNKWLVINELCCVQDRHAETVFYVLAHESSNHTKIFHFIGMFWLFSLSTKCCVPPNVSSTCSKSGILVIDFSLYLMLGCMYNFDNIQVRAVIFYTLFSGRFRDFHKEWYSTPAGGLVVTFRFVFPPDIPVVGVPFVWLFILI